MAIVNYSILPGAGGGLSWTGTFDVNSLADAVYNTVPTFITGGNETISFSFIPAQVAQYPAPGQNYTTWRTPSIVGQYPTSGYSFDIWSTGLYQDIEIGNTWSDLIAFGTYNLISNKNTLMYDYTAPVAPFWARGGTISFS